MKVLVISTSPRIKSNSDALANEFIRGAQDAGLTGWIDCFENAQLKGTVFAGGVTSMGEIEGHPALQKAYEMGKNV